MWFAGDGYEWLRYVPPIVNSIILIAVVAGVTFAFRKAYKNIIHEIRQIKKDINDGKDEL